MAQAHSLQGRGGGTVPLLRGGSVSVTRSQLKHAVRIAPLHIRFILLKVVDGEQITPDEQHLGAAYFAELAERLRAHRAEA